jgi:hypothetical protein
MYPMTDVRIVRENGEYFIYATPRTEGDEGMYSRGDYSGDPNSRMIGFNEVRGMPR